MARKKKKPNGVKTAYAQRIGAGLTRKHPGRRAKVAWCDLRKFLRRRLKRSVLLGGADDVRELLSVAARLDQTALDAERWMRRRARAMA